MDRFERIFLIILSLIVIYISFKTMNFWLRNYIFYSSDQDFPLEVNTLYNSVSGGLKRFYFCSYLNGPLLDHLNFTFIIFILIYSIYPHLSTVFFLHGFFISLPIIPIYRIARKKLNSRLLGIILPFFYLLLPLTQYALKGLITNRTILVLPFLFFLWYFYERKEFKFFLIFLTLSLLTKENVSLSLIFMGIYFLFKEKDKKWGLTTISFSLFIFLSYIFLALNISPFTGYFDAMIKIHFGEVSLKNFLDPFFIINRIFMPWKKNYLFNLLIQFYFIPFLGYKILLISLPKFFENLLYIVPRPNIKNDIMLLPFLVISFIYGLKKIKNFLNSKFPKKSSETFLLILLIFIILSNMFIVFNPEEINKFLRKSGPYYMDKNCEKMPPADYNERWNFLIGIRDEIPDEATIVVDNSILLPFSEKKNVFKFSHKPDINEVDYFVINEFLVNCLKDLDIEKNELEATYQISRINITELVEDPNFEIVKRDKGFLLLRKKG